jgi:acyl-CoA synthetase (NDP forming)
MDRPRHEDKITGGWEFPPISLTTQIHLSAVHHERFGPVVMVGAGGILADVIADRAFRLAPLAVDDAHAMLGELRTGPLLDGYRGAAKVSRDALCELVVRVGALADGLPDVAELDLNPVICRGRDLVVVDARIRRGGSRPEARSTAQEAGVSSAPDHSFVPLFPNRRGAESAIGR